MKINAITLVLGVLLPTVLAHLTSAPPLVLPHTHTTGRGVLGNLQERDLWKRQDQCDGSQFFCPTGTCFTDPANGYIGCCSVSSCAPRTSCIEYNPAISRPCDPNTGGCLYCSNTDNPHCLKITNVLASQWIQYCATVASTETLSYVNLITTGSQWSASTIAAIASTPSTSVAPSTTETSAVSSSTSSSSAIPASVTSDLVSASSFSPDQSLPVTTTAALLSSGAIGGIAAGAVAGLIIMGVGIWIFWKRSMGKREPPTTFTIPEKPTRDPPSPPTGTKNDPVEAEGSTPKEPSQFYSPNGFSQHHEADSRPVSMSPHPAIRIPDRGLGIRPVPATSHNRYSISSPNPATPTTDRGLPFVSPLSSQRESSPPSTPRQGRYYQNPPYTPSLYTAGPPGSIPHAADSRPPSLPQPYSVAAMPAEAPGSDPSEPRSGLYRGLSGRAGEATPPWAYLSAENAVNGGWKN